MDVPLRYSIAVLGTGLILAVGAVGQTQTRAVQRPLIKAANAWMKSPFDLSAADDLSPSQRRQRDAYWDARCGGFGVLTPGKVVHTSTGDHVGPADSDPEVPGPERSRATMMIATFSRYRTVLTASGRAIYTDVILTVGHVFQDLSPGHALTGLEVTVSLPGGTVRNAGGGVISFMTDPQEYFMQQSGTYLFSLDYMLDGDFYIGGPVWDLSDGVVKVNSDYAKIMSTRGKPSIVGLSKDELIRTLDERFADKR
jgi:hypothetical protein